MSNPLYRVENDVLDADCRETIYGSDPNVYRTREAADRFAAKMNTTGEWSRYQEYNGERPSYWVEEIDEDQLASRDVVED
jgi:hypothetical protein